MMVWCERDSKDGGEKELRGGREKRRWERGGEREMRKGRERRRWERERGEGDERGEGERKSLEEESRRIREKMDVEIMKNCAEKHVRTFVGVNSTSCVGEEVRGVLGWVWRVFYGGCEGCFMVGMRVCHGGCEGCFMVGVEDWFDSCLQTSRTRFIAFLRFVFLPNSFNDFTCSS